MRLTDIQIQALRLAAGHKVHSLNPKNNSTKATLHRRGLLNPDGTLAVAGEAELQERGFGSNQKDLDVVMYGEHKHGNTKAVNSTNEDLIIDSISGEQEKLLSKLVATHNARVKPTQKCRAKNRQARKSRRVNRQRAR